MLSMLVTDVLLLVPQQPSPGTTAEGPFVHTGLIGRAARMAEQQQQQEEAEGVYVEHQFMCSECHQLFGTLEGVLIHQQIHTGQDGEVEAVTVQGVPELEQAQHYQCLECGSLLLNPEELLQHQEMHMRDAGLEVVEQHGKRRARPRPLSPGDARGLDIRVTRGCTVSRAVRGVGGARGRTRNTRVGIGPVSMPGLSGSI